MSFGKYIFHRERLCLKRNILLALAGLNSIIFLHQSLREATKTENLVKSGNHPENISLDLEEVNISLLRFQDFRCLTK